MKRNALRLPALVVFGIYAIYGCLLAPLYQFLCTDVAWSSTIWLDIVDFFFNLFEVLGISASFGFLIHGIYRYTAAKCRPLYIMIGGALLFKYICATVAVSIVNGSLDLTADFTSFALSIVIELAELVFVVLLAHKLISTLQNENLKLKSAAAVLGKEYTPRGEFFPFSNLFNRTNPLQRSAFWGMIAVTALRLISYLIGELAFSLIGYGFSAGDIPVLLLYAFLLVFLPGFLGYLLSLGCMRLARRQDNKS